MEDNSKTVVLYRPANEAEFLVIGSMLDDREIPYMSRNKNIQNLFGAGSLGTGFNVITGEITILVNENDFEEASEVIRQFEEAKNREDNAEEE